MSSRADIEAVFPRVFDEVIRMIGVQPQGLGITTCQKGLALAVTLLERPKMVLPETILDVPVVFRISDPPVFLGTVEKPSRRSGRKRTHGRAAADLG